MNLFKLSLYMIIWCCIYTLVSSSTCYDVDGTSLCKQKKCKSDIKCAGNIGSDYCGCCDICLKQRGETCGGFMSKDGKCDHHAKYCLKLRNDGPKRCHTLEDALLNESPKYLLKMRQCKKSLDYFKVIKKNYISCFLNVTGPTFYCKKISQYRLDDCCLHNNGCHPNKRLYNQLNVNIGTSQLMRSRRELSMDVE